MRSLTKIILTWLTVMVVCASSVGASLFLLRGQKPLPVGPVLMNRTVIHWDFDMQGNYTRNKTWYIKFDDLFPEDSREYIVFPEFYSSEEWEMGGSVGEFKVRISMHLNDVYLYGFRHSFIMDGPGGAGYDEWYCGEDYVDEFSNATPKASDNVFEVKLSFSSNMSTFGDGWIDIIAGPLLLYANRVPSGWITFPQLTIVILLSAILALPATYAVNLLFRKHPEDIPHLEHRP